MKKFLFFTGVLLCSTSTFASQKIYDLRMELSIDGQLESSPRVIVKDGEKATVTQRDQKSESVIEVVASEQTNPRGETAVLMKFAIEKTVFNGNRKIKSKPQILAALNQKAEIAVGENNGKEVLALAVIASEIKE